MHTEKNGLHMRATIPFCLFMSSFIWLVGQRKCMMTHFSHGCLTCLICYGLNSRRSGESLLGWSQGRAAAPPTNGKWPLKAIIVGSSLCTGGWRCGLTLFSPVLMTECSSGRASVLSFNCCHLWCREGHYQREAEWKTGIKEFTGQWAGRDTRLEAEESACIQMSQREGQLLFINLIIALACIIPLGNTNLLPKKCGLDNLDKTVVW